jgi:hypothetical protein
MVAVKAVGDVVRLSRPGSGDVDEHFDLTIEEAQELARGQGLLRAVEDARLAGAAQLRRKLEAAESEVLRLRQALGAR